MGDFEINRTVASGFKPVCEESAAEIAIGRTRRRFFFDSSHSEHDRLVAVGCRAATGN
jgi:hypothetical protein